MDRENVIKGLECLAQKQAPTANPCKNCRYINRPNFAICVKDIASDALELLKEQKPKQVIDIVEFAEGMKVGRCPSCARSFVNLNGVETKFCMSCGQAVKWE